MGAIPGFWKEPSRVAQPARDYGLRPAQRLVLLGSTALPLQATTGWPCLAELAVVRSASKASNSTHTCRVVDQLSIELDTLLAYRGQSEVEAVFRQTKDEEHMAIRPQHHWTDQEIHVHAFICLLALLLRRVVEARHGRPAGRGAWTAFSTSWGACVS